MKTNPWISLSSLLKEQSREESGKWLLAGHVSECDPHVLPSQPDPQSPELSLTKICSSHQFEHSSFTCNSILNPFFFFGSGFWTSTKIAFRNLGSVRGAVFHRNPHLTAALKCSPHLSPRADPWGGSGRRKNLDCTSWSCQPGLPGENPKIFKFGGSH